MVGFPNESYPFYNRKKVLFSIFSGNFQICQAKSYVQEYLESSILFPGQYEFTIQTNDNNRDVVRVVYQSRHSKAKYYETYIQPVRISLLQYNLKKLKQNFLSYFLESNARSANYRLFLQLCFRRKNVSLL